MNIFLKKIAPVIAACLSVIPAVAWSDPWRLQDQVANDHLILKGQSLLRFETLTGQYRKGRGDSEDMLILRNRVTAGLRWGNWSVVSEFMDTRQALADETSPISAGMVNTLEFVQSYVQYRAKDQFFEGDELAVKVGKQVMDLGGRRLIASTRFRGSDNAFAGVRADWHSAAGTDLTGIYFMPVRRRPEDRAALLDNEHEVDEILDQTRFYGASVASHFLAKALRVEVTALQLTEKDTPKYATLDRDITTLGGRLTYRPEGTSLTLDAEAYYQWGDSSLGLGTGPLLDHQAWYGRVDLGWNFDGPMAPRLSLMYDYVSGDRDPTDGNNNRFSTLYGVQPPDYGWTGIYGAFVRENLKTPGIRLNLKPHKQLAVQMTWRKMNLAAARDRWVKAGLQDATGTAGDDLGSQLNAKAVWTVIPGNLRFMAGYSQLFAGGYQQRLTGKQFDTRYAFIEAIVDF